MGPASTQVPTTAPAPTSAPMPASTQAAILDPPPTTTQMNPAPTQAPTPAPTAGPTPAPTEQGVVISGSIALAVDGAADFVNNPAVREGLREGLAIAGGVAVENVDVTLTLARRLSLQGGQ